MKHHMVQPKIRKEGVEGVRDGYCGRPRPMSLSHDRERDEQAVGLGSGQLLWSHDTSFVCLHESPRWMMQTKKKFIESVYSKK